MHHEHFSANSRPAQNGLNSRQPIVREWNCFDVKQMWELYQHNSRREVEIETMNKRCIPATSVRPVKINSFTLNLSQKLHNKQNTLHVNIRTPVECPPLFFL